MNTRKYLTALVLAQVVCLALGLGFFHLYLTSSLIQKSDELARPELSAEVGRIAAAARGHDLASLVGHPDVLKSALDSRSAAVQSEDWQMALVDSNWHVLLETDDQGLIVPAPKSKVIILTPLPEARDATDGALSGWIDADDVHRLAAARPLPTGDGYLVVSRDVESVPIHAAEIRPMLIIGEMCALIWSSALIGFSLYIVVNYFRRADAQARQQPNIESLRQAQALVRTQETIIFGLAKLTDSRDPNTGDHLDRIAYYSSALASALRLHPDFRDVVTPSFLRLIGISAALHDIGKVGVEDAILGKPGPLTITERRIMEEHTRIGEECLKQIERRLGTSNFLQMAREIAFSHHERWDGGGYPLGISGEEIPLSARIVAIADVYDALSSQRIYKEAFPHEECVVIIARESGKHFDPRLVEVFLSIESSFRHISGEMATELHAKPSHLDDQQVLSSLADAANDVAKLLSV